MVAGKHPTTTVGASWARPLTVAEHFELEAPAQRPLPAQPFDPTLTLRPRVDGKSRVSVRRCYSVSVRFAGGRIDVRLGADRVEALEGRAGVADHARAAAKGTEVLVLDHYLEVFPIKPGAFPERRWPARLASGRPWPSNPSTPHIIETGTESIGCERRARRGDEGRLLPEPAPPTRRWCAASSRSRRLRRELPRRRWPRSTRS